MYLCENMCRETIAGAHRGQRLHISLELELEVGMSYSGVGIQLEPSARQYMFWVHEQSLDQTCFQSDGKWGPTAKVVVLWLLHVSMDRTHRNPDPTSTLSLSPTLTPTPWLKKRSDNRHSPVSFMLKTHCAWKTTSLNLPWRSRHPNFPVWGQRHHEGKPLSDA